MKSLVVHLTGPRNAQDKAGRYIGSSDISRVRLRFAVEEALRRNCDLFSPIKASEYRAHVRDLRVVSRELGYALSRSSYECGAAHTLANARGAIIYAYKYGYVRVIVATSEWHLRRATIAFQGVADVAQAVMGHRIDLEFIGSPMSRSRSVQRFEEFSMLKAERSWKCEAEERRVREYTEVALRELRQGFIPDPDVLCPYKSTRARRDHQSHREQNIRSRTSTGASIGA